MKRSPVTATPDGDTAVNASAPAGAAAAPTGAPFLALRRVNVFYGARQALADVSLSIDRVGITALVGPSGSGKTTLLTCVNRLTDLIPSCRVTGAIRCGDLDVLSPDTDVLRLRRRIGMIFQKPNPFPFSIRRNLACPLREHGVTDPRLIDARLESALRQVGLWDEVSDRLDTAALALSGGQQQRLCIARALMLSPDVLLMDEPCSALDPMSSGWVEDLITALRRQYTIVIVTHNLAQARRIADHAALFWVRDGVGRLIEHGPAAQLFDHPRHELTAAYINGVRG